MSTDPAGSSEAGEPTGDPFEAHVATLASDVAADVAGDVADAPPVTRRRRRWPRALAILAVVLALILGLAAIGIYSLAKQLEGNVTTIEGFEAAQPVQSFAPVNILVMGSDNREGGNSSAEQAAEIAGERSDTTLLVHISANRQEALVVSIPRDTLLKLPTCASESGKRQVEAKFNSAFMYGGASCTVETVEQMTGVNIDHAVVVDFLGFKKIVDIIGGVQVCLEEPVADPDSGLDLPAGWSTVTGDQALAFVRARKSLGDGSDIDRIARQQQFLSSAIRQVTDAQYLLKPVTLYRMLDAATTAVSVDGGINEISEVASLAQSLRNLHPENIKFVTMPFYYTPDFLNVVVNEPVATEIWTAIANDETWPKPTAGPTPESLTVPASAVTVLVLNGNGLDDAATGASQDLRSAGFTVSGMAMAESSAYPDSVVIYHPEDAEAARTLQAAVAGSLLHEDPSAVAGRLQLIVGGSYEGVTTVDVPRVPQGTASDPAPTTAAQSLCAA